MSIEEAIDTLRHGAKHNPKAVMAWAYILTHQRPEDAPMIVAILAAIFQPEGQP